MCLAHVSLLNPYFSLLFFFNHPPTTEIYTLSLHDALPILAARVCEREEVRELGQRPLAEDDYAGVIILGKGTLTELDRKSTRLNSSHMSISYAVFCLKKKKKKIIKKIAQ